MYRIVNSDFVEKIVPVESLREQFELVHEVC